MLVLSRQEGEKLVIDGNITIRVVRIAGGKVRLGIEAPPAVSIRRVELPGRVLPEILESASIPTTSRLCPSAAPSR